MTSLLKAIKWFAIQGSIMAKIPKRDDEYGQEEAAERFRKALGGALATPPRKHADEPKRRKPKPSTPPTDKAKKGQPRGGEDVKRG